MIKESRFSAMNINFDKYTDKGQYKVPEGYFDTLTERIMANIPAEPVQKKKPLVISLSHRLKYAVAACFAAVIIGGTTYHFYNENDKELYSEEYVNDYIDYAMVDDNDMYEYLSDQSYGEE